MAVVNTTYNFNQPNMNLGECIGYGILGSLTGNMGMYGMGMYGGFGMGGSIFPMGTMMGGYGCMPMIGGYTNQIAGMQLGNAFASIALNCLTQAIGGGRGGSDKTIRREQIDTSRNNVNNLLSDIKDLEDENTELKKDLPKTGNVSSSVLKACPTEAKDYNDAVDKLEKLGSDITQSESHKNQLKVQDDDIESANKTIEKADADQKSAAKILKDDPNNADALQKKKDAEEAIKKANATKAAAEKEKQEIEKKYKEDVQAAKTKKTDAEVKLKAAITKKIQENEDIIKEKKKELAKEQSALEDEAVNTVKISKKCDDNDEFNNIAGENVDKDCNPENIKDFVKAFNYKFSQFCKSSGTDKKSAAEKALKVYDKINDYSSKYITDDMKRNMNIMKKYIENGNQFGINE